MPEKSDVFISHNSKDKPDIEKILVNLVDYVNVWFDKADMYVGDDWVKQVENALINSNICAVFVGKNGLGKYHKKEVEIAQRLGVKILFVFLAGANIDETYQELDISKDLVYINFTQSDNRTSLELLIGGILGKAVGWEFLVGLKLNKRSQEWNSKKSAKLLYRDVELSSAEVWILKHPNNSNSIITLFIIASKKAQRKRQIFQITAIILVLALFCCIVILLGSAWSYFSPSILNPPPKLPSVSIPEGIFQPTEVAALMESTPPAYYLNGFKIAENSISANNYNICRNAKNCTGNIGLDQSGNSLSNLPVVNVSWQEADQFCRWMNGRLPSAVEIQKLFSISHLDEIRYYDWTSDWCLTCSPPNAYKTIQGVTENRFIAPEDRYSYVTFRCVWDVLP